MTSTQESPKGATRWWVVLLIAYASTLQLVLCDPAGKEEGVFEGKGTIFSADHHKRPLVDAVSPSMRGAVRAASVRAAAVNRLNEASRNMERERKVEMPTTELYHMMSPTEAAAGTDTDNLSLGPTNNKSSTLRNITYIIPAKAADKRSSAKHRDVLEIFVFASWILFAILCCAFCTLIHLRRDQFDGYEDQGEESMYIIIRGQIARVRTEEWKEGVQKLLNDRLSNTKLEISEQNFVTGEDTDVECGMSATFTGDDSDDMELKIDKETSFHDPHEGDSSISTPAEEDEDDGDKPVAGNDSDAPALLRLPCSTVLPATGTTDSNDAGEDDDDVDNNDGPRQCRNVRTVPNSCAICLSPYESGEFVVWSPSSENADETKASDAPDESRRLCTHAFHNECIVAWCVKKMEEDPTLTSCLCPCCRQEFVNVEEDEKGDKIVEIDESDNNNDDDTEEEEEGQ